MTLNDPHDHPPPPPRLIASSPIDNDPSVPEREVLTPMGKSKFRNAGLEEKGYRFSFARNCDEKLVEIVYLKDDGTTGTVIADIDSLLETEIVARDGKPICLVTFKLLRKIENPVNLHRAEVPISSVSDGIVGNMLRGLLDYFLEQIYGRKANGTRTQEAGATSV